MRPILCAGGYGVPMRAGAFQIVHVTAACSDSNASSRLQISEAASTIANQQWVPKLAAKLRNNDLLIDLKRVAACQPNIDWSPQEQLQVTKGLAIIKTENLEPGSIFVYIK
jgi:hypothetical protein